jgi:hypothetical protein
MPGKIPTRTKIETFFKKGVWDLIREEFSKCENKESAANRLSHLTQGKIAITPITILNMVQKGIDSGEIKEKDFFYSWGIQVKDPNSHRGKKSIREKMEKYTGKNLWDWLRTECKDCTNKEEASKRISDFTEERINMSGVVLAYTIEKGFNNKEINEKDFFVKWIVPKRKHNPKKDEVKNISNGIVEPKIILKGKCQNCGQEVSITITKRDLFEMGVGVKGKRCQKCQLWATYIFTGEVNGKPYTEECKTWKESNKS